MSGRRREPATKRFAKPRKGKATLNGGVIELEVDGVAMRVGRGADARTIAAVIAALKTPS
jgi:transposase